MYKLFFIVGPPGNPFWHYFNYFIFETLNYTNIMSGLIYYLLDVNNETKQNNALYLWDGIVNIVSIYEHLTWFFVCIGFCFVWLGFCGFFFKLFYVVETWSSGTMIASWVIALRLIPVSGYIGRFSPNHLWYTTLYIIIIIVIISYTVCH